MGLFSTICLSSIYLSQKKAQDNMYTPTRFASPPLCVTPTTSTSSFPFSSFSSPPSPPQHLPGGISSWRRRRPPASRGVWCLKVYDIISGPDRWQGSGVSPAAGGENFWAFFFPSKHTICVCIYIYIYITYMHDACFSSKTHALAAKPSLSPLTEALSLSLDGKVCVCVCVRLCVCLYMRWGGRQCQCRVRSKLS